MKIGILKLCYLICVFFTALLWSRFRSNRGRGQESNQGIGGQGSRGQGRGNRGQSWRNPGTQDHRGQDQGRGGHVQGRGGHGQGRGGLGQGNQSQSPNINGNSSPSTSRNLQQVGSNYRAVFAWNIFVKYQRVWNIAWLDDNSSNSFIIIFFPSATIGIIYLVQALIHNLNCSGFV